MQPAAQYRRQYRRCGKPNCRRCADGPGHGPYWYAIWREAGQLKTRYVGKELPAGIAAAADHPGEDEQAPRPAASAASGSDDAAAAPRDPPPSAGLRIWLLGRFRVECQGRPITDWRRASAATLLKLLALADRHRLPREALAGYVTASDRPDFGRESLSVAVHALRRTLEPGLTAGCDSRYIAQEGDALVLQAGAQDWIDVVAFEQALDLADAADDPLAPLAAAVDLYGGDLLPEEPGDWCVARREALRLRWQGALLRLSEAQARHGRHEQAMATLHRLLAVDPTQEEAACRLMTLLNRQGRRSEALRIYATVRQALRQELRAAPSPEMEAIAAALRAGAPLPARRRRAAGPDAAPARAPQPAPIPLVGRESELAQVHRSLLAARSGHGGAVVLQGEAGIGKTRLAEEAATMAATLGFTVLWGRSAEGEQDLPYAPFAEALCAYIGNRPVPVLRRQLIGAEALVTLLPDLTGMLGIVPPPPLESSGAERLRLWMALRSLLAAASQSRPLVLVLDDLQWVDDASLGLLAFLLRRSQDLRLLVLATMRDESPRRQALHDVLIEGQRDGRARVLPLGGLSPSSTDALVRHRLGVALPPDQVAALQAQCNGNPFFIGELLALLAQDLGSPGNNDDAPVARRVAAVLAGDGALPTTVRHTLTRRLDRIGDACRGLLRIGSVIGERFDSALLADVAGQERVACEEILDEAIAAGLLREDVDGPYRLAHALLRRTLYDELLPGQRRRLHARVAAALACGHLAATGASAEVVALHYARTQEHALAAQWLERAGDHARAMLAPLVASRHYAAALERLLLTPDDRGAMRSRLEEKLGDMRLLEGSFGAAGDHFSMARSLEQDAARRADLWRKEAVTWERRGAYARALAALDAVQDDLARTPAALPRAAEASLELCRGEVYYRMGNLAGARVSAQHGIDLLGEDPPASTAARAYNLLGSIALFEGAYPEAERHYRQSLALREHLPEGLRDEQGIACAWNNLGLVALYQGDLARAAACQRQSLAAKEKLGDQAGIAVSLYNLGEALAEQGDVAAAAASCRRARQMARRLGYSEVEALAAVGQAYASLRAGRPRLGEALLAHGRAMAIAHRSGKTLVYAALLTAELHLARRQYSRAHEAAQEALDLATAVPLPRQRAAALRLLGRSLHLCGRPDEAESRLREALRQFEAMRAVLEVARTQVALADLLLRDGPRASAARASEAGALLQQARACFLASGAAWDVREAERVGRHVGVLEMEPASST